MNEPLCESGFCQRCTFYSEQLVEVRLRGEPAHWCPECISAISNEGLAIQEQIALEAFDKCVAASGKRGGALA